MKAAALAPLEAAGRPVRYLNSGKDDKHKIAQEIASAEGITEGPVCALTALELGSSYAIRLNGSTHKPELQIAARKCLFVYQYWMHPVFGLMRARLQTWFPFPIHVYLNGREWLARQIDRAGLRYRRQGNCFAWIEDSARAQALMDQQQRVHWAELFEAVARGIHPLLFSELSRKYAMNYDWSCVDSEWALDLMFRQPEQLPRIVPQLLRFGLLSFSSPDVLRFMGKKVDRHGEPFGRHALPQNSDLKRRGNGARIKHRLGPNSIKLYDKAYTPQGAVLRTEVTISAPQSFRIFRRTDDPQAQLAWRTMRQSVADLHARGEVSQKILDRYCSALAAIDDSTNSRRPAPRRCAGKASLSAVSGPSIHPITPCSRPSTAANSPSPDCATATSSVCSIPLRRETKPSNAAARPPSAASCACCGPMACSANVRVPTLTTSLRKAAKP